MPYNPNGSELPWWNSDVQDINPDFEPTPIPQYPGGGSNPSTTASGGGYNNYTPPMNIPLVQPPGVPQPYNEQPAPRWLNFMPPAVRAAYGGYRLGSRLADMYHNYKINHPSNQQQPSDSGGGGGFSMPNLPQGYDPFGGLPEGFQENNRFGMGAPTFTAPGAQGPQFGGGSIFNANIPGGRASPLAGAFTNLGAGGGELGDFGAKLALHSGRFRDALQNMGYNNLAAFQRATGFNLGSRGLGGGQGVGGAGRPMTQNY